VEGFARAQSAVKERQVHKFDLFISCPMEQFELSSSIILVHTRTLQHWPKATGTF
jgi:hypothetical protein